MYTISVPRLGEGIAEVSITRLLVPAGATVELDQAIYEAETDKSVTEMESPVAGRLARWLVSEGDVVPVGTAIAHVETVEQAGQPAPPGQAPPASPRISPRARARARAAGMADDELTRLAAGSRLATDADVDDLLARAGRSPRPHEGGHADAVVPPARRAFNETLRRAYADSVPAVVGTSIPDSTLRAASARLQDSSPAGMFATPPAVFAYLVAACAARHSEFRTRRLGADRTRTYARLDLGIAVTHPARGLAIAVIRAAETLSFAEFVLQYADAVQRARTGASQADSTVTAIISHIDETTSHFAVPIVVPPATSTIFLAAPDAAGQRAIALAFDHLAFDGAQAAAILSTLRSQLEDPPGEPGASPPARSGAGNADDPIVRYIAAQVESLVGNAVADTTPLGDAGLSSAQAVTLAHRLNQHYGAELAATAVWTHPTIRHLAMAVTRGGPSTAAHPVSPRPAGPAKAPIAIIGMGIRFPGASHFGQLPALLDRQACCYDDIPADRLPGFSPSGSPPVLKAALLPDVAAFDAQFFGMNGRSAAAADPQQRLLLEVSWQALEHAAIRPDALAGSCTGVFAAAAGYDYRELAVAAGLADASTAIATLPTFLANRLSQFYDLHGPSISVDTACSGGLTSVALAVAALRSGQCDLALAAGVNVICNGFSATAYQRAGMLSPTGRGTAFDALADGYVRGEGAAVAVLKRLDDAREAGDPVLAVIRGIAVNHAGRTASATAPNPHAQATVIRDALRDADLGPADIGYLEAHGTATPLGDPIEVQGVIEAFYGAAATSAVTHAGPEGRVWLGSIKANIGHLEGAAGMAGLAKAVAAVQHGRIWAMPGFSRLNPAIDLGGVPVSIPSTHREWPAAGSPRRAGVSSFGIGGSGAHAIIEEPPATLRPPQEPGEGPWAIPLSAGSPAALRAHARDLAEHLSRTPQPVEAVAATLQLGRRALSARAVILAASPGQLIDAARCLANGTEHPSMHHPGTAAARRLPEPAQRWLADGTPDWRACWPGRSAPPRICLPPRSFHGSPYWLPGAPPPSATATAPRQASSPSASSA
jgi:3-oxoacyl-(acyl-carrier-protein) synthase/pyruvate/2-oxoglutarate dehydrogenase complex dihydrolipoamide acyltransferase (E2) component